MIYCQEELYKPVSSVNKYNCLLTRNLGMATNDKTDF